MNRTWTVLPILFLVTVLFVPTAAAQGPADPTSTSPDTNRARSVSTPEAILYFWDFEGNNGGFVGTLDWEWGTYAWVGNGCYNTSNVPPPAPYSGTDMWGTVLNTCYSDLGNNADPCANVNANDDSILSFTIDLTSVTPPVTMTWWEWYDLFGSWDWSEVYVNGNVAWQNCSSHVVPTAWEQQTVDLSPYVGGPVTIEFHMMASTVVNYAGWYIDDVMITAASEPPIVWDKTIDGLSWTPGISVTRQTSDTIVAQEVLHLTPPPPPYGPATDLAPTWHPSLDYAVEQGPIFAQTESWNPARLHLLDWAATGGDVITATGHLTWTGEIVDPVTITLTKWFHVAPCTWTQTLLWEELWLDGVELEERPVLIHKLPPQLWIGSSYDPLVWGGMPAEFLLGYGNLGGYENDVTVYNEFPPEAPFAFSDPLPDDVDPNGLWAEWWVGDLPMDAQGHITVTVYITDTVLPGDPIYIYDWIIDHVDEPADTTEIMFEVAELAIYLPLVLRAFPAP